MSDIHLRDATVDQLANALTEEIARLREQLDRTNTERQRLAEELAEVRADADRHRIDMGEADAEAEEMREQRDALLAKVERLRDALCDILGHFTDKGSIGGIHNSLRTCWVTTSKVDGWREALNGEAGERHGNLYATIRATANWLDEHNGADRAELAARILKLVEEVGEAATAWIGATGQNPRKGITHTYADVAAELGDAAFTALVAVESLGHDPAAVMAACVAKIAARIEPVVSRG